MRFLGSAYVRRTGLSYSSHAATVMMTYKHQTDTSGNIFSLYTNATYVSITSSASTIYINGVSHATAWNPGASGLFDGQSHLLIFRLTPTDAEVWMDGVAVASVSHAVAEFTLDRFQTILTPIQGFGDEAAVFTTALTAAQIGDLWAAWQGGGPISFEGASTGGSAVTGKATLEGDGVTLALAGAAVGVASVEVQIRLSVVMSQTWFGQVSKSSQPRVPMSYRGRERVGAQRTHYR